MLSIMMTMWMLLSLVYLIMIPLIAGDCSTQPDAIPNSSNNATTPPYADGTLIKYTCGFGYIPIGYRQSTCSGTSWVWQHDQRLACSPVRCPSPPNISNGQRTGSRVFGRSMIFSCYTGYKISGDSELICQANREWDVPYPTCIVVQCDRLYNPSNGNMNSIGRDYGHVAKFKCDHCYTIQGSERRKCQANGTWSGSNAYCTETVCRIPHIPYGYISPEQNSCEDLIEYRCNDNATRRNRGDNTAQCLPSGDWTNKESVCMGPCVVPKIGNGTVDVDSGGTFVTHDHTVTIRCDMNYTLDGLSPRKCYNGTIEELPRCVLPSDCPFQRPTHSKFLNIDLNDRVNVTIKHGDQVEVTCDDGYNTPDKRRGWIVMCTNGKLNPTAVLCVESDCPFQRPTHSKFLNIDLNDRVNVTIKHGDQVEVTCDDGYNTPDKRRGWTVMCTNGKLNPTAVLCVESDCPFQRPTHSKFLNIDLNDRVHVTIKHGDQVEVICDDGYNTPDKHRGWTIMCSNGKLNPTAVLCVGSDCPFQRPTHSKFLNIDLNDRVNVTIKHGDQVEVTCDDGYNTPDKRRGWTVMCTNGKLNPTAVLCVESDCPFQRPTHSKFLNIDLNDRVNVTIKHGDQVEVTCDDGYNTPDKRRGWTVMCTNGKLNPTAVLCVESDCPFQRPTHSKFLNIDLNDRVNVTIKHGDQVEVTCDDGYNTPDKRRGWTVMCTNGKLNPTAVLCVESDCPFQRPTHSKFLNIDLNDRVNVTIKHGDQVEVTCDDGYNTPDKRRGWTVMCTNGKLNPTAVLCVESDCPFQRPTHSKFLNIDLNGRVNVTIKHGDQVEVTCDDGYNTPDKRRGWTVMCTNGKLNPTAVLCVESDCPFQRPTHSKFLNIDLNDRVNVTIKHGDQVEVICDDGYNTPDKHRGWTIMCSNGKLNPTAVLCVGSDCPFQRPTHSKFLNIDLNDRVNVTIKHGDQVEVTCDHGYNTPDKRRGWTVMCTNGKLNPTAVLCVESDCPFQRPTHSKFLNIDLNDRVNVTIKHGDQVEVTCDDGYNTPDKRRGWTVMCSNGKLNPTAVLCVEKRCSTPPDNRSMEIIPTPDCAPVNDQYAHNCRVIIRCKTAVGAADKATTLLCYFGQWKGAQPDCSRMESSDWSMGKKLGIAIGSIVAIIAICGVVILLSRLWCRETVDKVLCCFGGKGRISARGPHTRDARSLREEKPIVMDTVTT